MAFDSGAVAVSRPKSFTLKGALLPMTLLELRTNDASKIASELAQKVAAAPDFFGGSPVVVSVESVVADVPFLTDVIDICARLGFRLAGVKGDGQHIVEFTKVLQLGHFPGGKVKNLSKRSLAGKRSDPQAKSIIDTYIPTKTIVTPVRSGQQIYSDGDLIVLAQVSAGAELLAAGCIHVYAPMRGRALAGVKGDESARIFCMSQQAELVSIAGHFMIDENLRDAYWQRATQIFFDGNELQVEPIAGFSA
ncbi:septum site-determining protein MinC [Marinagarivorans algicola]|uniref:septum site-determining protein MinC n=1 Tax=Marinagarivorans algicola TaxID=1513270 RepID=UPI00373625A6